VIPAVAGALRRWEERECKRVDYVAKGHNPWTEHYSAVRADVPDPFDSSTQLNIGLLTILEGADLIALSGQALSHCVANTADYLGQASVHKLVLIEDTSSPVPGFEDLAHSSPVPGFEDLAQQFLQDLRARGLRTARAADFLR